MSDAGDLSTQLAAVARALLAEDDVQATLDKAISMATDLVRGCEYAGVSLVRRGQSIDTPAATHNVVRRGDELQYELGEGPCLEAIWDDETVLSHDLASDPRWPSWGPRTVDELGVRSVLCFQLFTHDNTLGALNLYSQHVDAFDADDCTAGRALAAHVAVALAAAEEIGHLGSAITSRTVIGQAEGILMERFDVSAQQAFAILRRVSQQQNVKLYEVARQLVETRRTPGG
ncbi:MAG: GAF and ANTAR domain-containing protein [Actinomycetota bacterium]|nr:GAF and ANTAR domain-containing protein [Actinomycetota bacterium]